MSEVRSVPADYGRSRLTVRTRWRATRCGRRDSHAGIGAGHYAQELAGGLATALGELRSGFTTRHAALIDRVREEAARIVTEYDRRDGDAPAALARFGGWVSQWRTEVAACQQRGLALTACAEQELAHYRAAYARAARQEEPCGRAEPAGRGPRRVLDGRTGLVAGRPVGPQSAADSGTEARPGGRTGRPVRTGDPMTTTRTTAPTTTAPTEPTPTTKNTPTTRRRPRAAGRTAALATAALLLSVTTTACDGGPFSGPEHLSADCAVVLDGSGSGLDSDAGFRAKEKPRRRCRPSSPTRSASTCPTRPSPPPPRPPPARWRGSTSTRTPTSGPSAKGCGGRRGSSPGLARRRC